MALTLALAVVLSVGSGSQCCTATFRVRVPEGAGVVYLTGSLPRFGPWRADALAMAGAGPSRFLGPARRVEVWLPPGYGDAPATRYPVLYMHDGQNLFDPRIANTGVD
ncbi:MAG: hypothetical protein H0X69_06285 [Gemmatimonadales bacterium]|nr:hypothetical protein [Gemmatimonadales bacterium]